MKGTNMQNQFHYAKDSGVMSFRGKQWVQFEILKYF